ncbi:asparagine synthetase B family protein, partial [Thermodesulfobacteriota bacterium]
LFVQAARRMREDPIAVVPRTYSTSDVSALTGLDYNADWDPVLQVSREWSGLDPVSQMLFSDMQTYMAEDILTKVDRMSMAHSLEVRAPILDYRVVELACRMPLSFKLHRMNTKRILKDVARKHLPPSIIDRSKYGFQVPLGAWLKGELKGWAEERLFDESPGYLNKKFVSRIWQEHQIGRADNAHKIWLLLVFNEWRGQFV